MSAKKRQKKMAGNPAIHFKRKGIALVLKYRSL